ncbi:MAG TPA: exodeoxyribonuclease V subunit alpha [Xanthomonadales bacterium]|nr:exodeoxyribonuclease V subunit alpha [Xanthomonadales bacterium]
MSLSWSSPGDAVLGDVDVALARTLERLWPGAEDEALRVAAIASWAVQEGHGCLDLAALRADPAMRAALLADPRVGEIDTASWRRALEQAPFAGDGDAALPLVLDGERIYLRRYHAYEVEVARALRALAAPTGAVAPRATGEDRQLHALERALAERLTVVCGGPGTGKTWTIARLVERLSRDEPAARIAVAAPTGKAAARLTAALREALPAAASPPAATTLHRLLGIGGADREPRHGRERPLPVDVLIVDECSMVDLALFAKMLRALAPHCRLVLVGDPRQLPAVEGGAVLGELAALGASGEGGFGACVVTLDRSHRFEQAGAIAALTRAIESGDPDATFAALRGSGVAWHDDALLAARAPFDALARASYAGIRRASDPASALEALARFRVLCALRAGPYGVSGINAAVESALGVARAERLRYPGRPILVLENDAALGLYNGDTGVVVADAERGAVALVGDPRGAPRRHALSQLPAHETAYAMTAHKAQGSEFEEVAIVLPPEPHPLVTREWLYTAVSRARSGLHVFAPRGAIEAALGRRVTVMSGLRERLAGA